MSSSRSIDDYPQLSACVSDLRSCSLDDGEGKNGCGTFLFDADGFDAVNFDAVMRAYFKSQAVPRSVDAFYVGRSLDAWDGVVRLIEFKNGGLYSRQKVLTSRERAELRKEMIGRIDKVLENNATPLNSVGLYSKLDGELEQVVNQCISERLGRGDSKARDRDNPHHPGDSFVLESVKTKALCSSLVLLDVIDESPKFIRENVEFILVYNPAVNPGDEVTQVGSGNRSVASSPAITAFQSNLAKCAGRPASRFGLKQSLGALFRDVLTLTSDELIAHLDG